MTMPSTAEAREVYRNMEYLKELGYLAAPGEHPGLELMLEIYKTAGAIRDALMRVKPGMMAERDGYARISQMQAALWLDTDGEQTGALVSVMLGPMMFVLICGDD